MDFRKSNIARAWARLGPGLGGGRFGREELYFELYPSNEGSLTLVEIPEATSETGHK